MVLGEILYKKLTDKHYCRALLILGHLTFLILGIFSWLFYKERMLHFDTANYVYHLIYFQEFYTGHDRFVSILPQLLPLWAARAGWSLEWILRLYSISFILLYYGIYLLIVYGFRNVKAGLFTALALVLTLRYKFYAPVGEVVISIAFIGLIVGVLTSNWYSRGLSRVVGDYAQRLDGDYAQRLDGDYAQRLGKIGLVILLSALFVFIHPFAMLTLGAVWLIWLVYFKKWKNAAEYLLPLSWLFIWGGKLLIGGGGTSYESGRLSVLSEAQEILFHLNEYYIWDRFIWYLNAHYALPLLLFVGALGYLVYKKKWLTALFALLSWCFLAAVVIILHSYLNGPIYIMLDGYLAHLGVIMAFVFVFSFGKSRSVWGIILFSILIGFSLDRIRGVHQYYEGREYLLLNIIKGNSPAGETKLLGQMDAFDYDRLWLPWAVGIETHLMTSLRDADKPQTLYFQNDGQNLETLSPDSSAFLSIQYAPDTFKVEAFPPQLFLPKGVYKKLDLKRRY